MNGMPCYSANQHHVLFPLTTKILVDSMIFGLCLNISFSPHCFPLFHAGGLNVEGEADSWDFGVGKDCN